MEKQESKSAFLIKESEEKEVRSKSDYIKNAEAGLIVAFRLYFQSKSKVKLTKVISGKILENDKDNELYTVETKNGLKYGVPYDSVEWVKTGSRWSKEVYEEMKQGSVEVKSSEVSNFDFGEIDLDSPVDHES